MTPTPTTGEPLSTLPTGTGEVGSREKNSQRVGEKLAPWRPTYGVRTCPVCGGEFTAAHFNQVYCPPTDRDRERAPNSQPRSRCAKRADNATRYGGSDPRPGRY